jgi:hypothetical protein
MRAPKDKAHHQTHDEGAEDSAPPARRALRPTRHSQLPEPKHRGREQKQDDHNETDDPGTLQSAAKDRTAQCGEDAEHRVGNRNSHDIGES